MKREFRCVGLAALLLAAGLLRADDAYPVKFKQPVEGDVMRVEKSESTTIQNKAVDAAGKVLTDQKQVVEETAVYTETIVKCRPGKLPTVSERKYDKAVVTNDGKKTDLAYQGKTVAIEQKDGKYHFSVDGKELAEEDARSLSKEFNREDDSQAELEKLVLPQGMVKVNESWMVDMAPILKVMSKPGEMEVDGDKAKGTGTLLKAYKKDDKQCGLVKVELRLPIKSVGKGNMKIGADQGSVMTMEAIFDGCIDGSSGAAGVKNTFKMDVNGTTPDGIRITISGLAKGEETREALPKK